MKKFFVFVLMVLLAIVPAGIYGMVHNQISYTVSPEYFTKFKFRQFGLVDLDLPDRARASIAGFLASWRMGIPIGLIVSGVGSMHPGHWRMLKMILLSFLVVIAVTFLFGICGLWYGWRATRTTNIADYQDWHIPNDVVDLRRFLCVGYMHNSSYLGGALAILVAAAFQIAIRFKTKNPLK